MMSFDKQKVFILMEINFFPLWLVIFFNPSTFCLLQSQGQEDCF